jgi:hypothetical protein
MEALSNVFEHFQLTVDDDARRARQRQKLRRSIIRQRRSNPLPLCFNCNSDVVQICGAYDYWIYRCCDCSATWNQMRPPALPSLKYLLRKAFRASLWCVRLAPKRLRRLATLQVLKPLPIEMKHMIIVKANLMR